jgi:ferritin-like metal-binding protein YciE
MQDAEKKLVNALKTMESKCQNEELVRAFEHHRTETQEQAARLDEVFGMVGRKPRREPCVGINGLIEEFSKFVQQKPAPAIIDVFATGAAEKVEHYEICAYESLIQLGDHLRVPEAVDCSR